jgi:hypothetical protein
MNDSKVKYECVYEAGGKLDAEMICGFLESFGIAAIIYQESVGVTYGLTVGPLGKAKIMVPEDQYEEAMVILKDMEAGKYQLPEPDDALGECPDEETDTEIE